MTCQAFEGMHLRENHIIPEIIDEQGNVLPDGQYGELVITTIGADAMPLIRYRTGDYTCILPPCPCGGVTKRIDTVSRKMGVVSIEKLDSALLQIPTLVDYRASYDGKLHLDCRCKDVSVMDLIVSTIKVKYPQLEIQIDVTLIAGEDRPLYLGKRYVVT